MMKEIEPWEYIVANKLNFLSGNVVELLTEYARTKDIQLLEEACRELGALTARERYLERSCDADDSD
jgi:hypothetical protein